MAGRPRSFDRDQALTRAMEVFWAKGYAVASMAELTAAMGINAPSLYAAFGSKETLFREAVELYQRTQGEDVWTLLEGEAPVRNAVEALLLAAAEAAACPDKPKGCLIVLSGAHPDQLPDGVCGDLEDIRARSMALLETRLREARASGEIGAGSDPAAIAAFYATVYQGMNLRARDGATPEELRGTVRAAMAAWGPLTGIG